MRSAPIFQDLASGFPTRWNREFSVGKQGIDSSDQGSTVSVQGTAHLVEACPFRSFLFCVFEHLDGFRDVLEVDRYPRGGQNDVATRGQPLEPGPHAAEVLRYAPSDKLADWVGLSCAR